MSETYVEIMLQSMKKKNEVLDCIIELNFKQKDILEDPQGSPEDFDEIVEQKAACIEQLEQLDSGFEKLFARTKDELEGNKERYASRIKELQEYIRSVTDKSMEIQAQEARNKDLMTKKFASVRKMSRSLRTGSEVANKYHQSMNKVNYVDPQFMDNKQ